MATLETHVSGRDELSRNIWGLVTLSLWLDKHGRSGGADDAQVRRP